MTSHAVVLQDVGALAPKAITEHIFFFKTVTLIVFVIYFLIKVEINLLNNVNLTDCFTSTLRLEGICMVLLGMRTSIQRNFCHTVQQ